MRMLHRAVQRRSYLTDGGDRVQFALDGRDSIDEGWPEDDAFSSVRKVWYVRQLVEESGAQPRGQEQDNVWGFCASLYDRD